MVRYGGRAAIVEGEDEGNAETRGGFLPEFLF